ncbi:YjfB family protein [Brevibacillus agri]
MNAIQLQQAVNVSVMKQVLDTGKAQASILLDSLRNTDQNIREQASHPVLGRTIDIRA